MCDCFHLAFPNWHAASSGTGAGRRLRGPEAATGDDSTCDEPSQFTEGERPRPQGSSPVEEFPEGDKYTDSDKECEAEHDLKSGSGKKTKKSGLGSMFEKRSTPKMSKLKEVHSPESEVIVNTAKDGCAEGLIYGGGGREGIFIKQVVPESPASKSLKVKEGDQILSATVYFDNVTYEDAIQILEHAQAYKLKLCLKRKPDITETEPVIESDVIPEEEVYPPEMREQGKTKRRGDARISWPKFPSFGKGRKSRFARSHSSSEADEQRKLELSPTTSDTESPIKSQDALKGKKKHKMKLSLTKRSRISSSEDQDTDIPTTGQASSDVHQAGESDMLTAECFESPPGETPQVYVTEDLKVKEGLRVEQNIPTMTEAQTAQHKVELISIDSTLKTADLTVELANQESPIKSPDGKKKKKEKSELKIKLLGKDKSHKKEAKAKSSPKRLKTLGASFEIAEQPENEKSAKSPGDQPALDANIQMNAPKEELEKSDVTFTQKSPKKGEEKTQKGKGKQKQESKSSTTFKLPKVGLGDISAEETIQKMSVNVEESTTTIQQLTTKGAEVKEDPYEILSKSSVSRTQLPKREDIEIPGMEDMSRKTKVKGIKKPKAVYTGHHEEIQAETVQMSIDVDSVKEAVSKLPGFKLPKVDTSGVPIPEEITVIDANAQRISVKTPTKVVDTKAKHEAHLTKFDLTASPDITKTTVKLPKITPADFTSEELLIATKVDIKRTQKEHKTKTKESDKDIKTGEYKRDEIVIPGKESAPVVSILQTQQTEAIQLEYESAATKESDKKSKKAKITMPSFGIGKPDITIPNIGIDLPKQRLSEHKGDAVKGVKTTVLQEEKMSDSETRKDKGHIGGVICDVKIPEVDGIEYIDSADGSPVKMGGVAQLTGFDVNLEAKPKADISFQEIKREVKDVEAEQTVKLPKFGAVTSDISASVLDGDKDVNIDGCEIKTLEREGKGSKFKVSDLGISMPKGKELKVDLSLSKKDASKVEVKLPEAPETDVTLGRIDVSIPEHKIEVQKPEMEIKALEIENELDGQGSKFKMPKFGFQMPKVKGPEFDLSLSKKDVDVTLPEAKGKLPAVELKDSSANIEIRAPEIEVAEKDAEGSPSKFKMPTFKLPKFGAAAPSISAEVSGKIKDTEISETQLHTPKKGVAVDITTPNTDIVGPSVDVKTIAAGFDGKGSKFKMPKFGISLPKVKGPEIDLGSTKKDVDVALSKPTAEVELPAEPGVQVEIKASEIALHKDIEGSPSKFKMPAFTRPQLEAGTPTVSLERPNIDKDVKIDGAGANIPEVGSAVNIAAPGTDVEGPSVDIKITGAEHEGKGSKFKMPHLGFSMPKVKGPKIDSGLPKKHIDVTLQEGNVKLPEVDLGEADVSIPEVTMEVQKPELEMQTLQTEGQLDGQGGKFKMPKFGIKVPKIKGPEIDLSLSKKDADVQPQTKIETELPEAPKIDICLGKAEVLIPEATVEVKKPEVQIQPLKTDVELERQGGKFKMPKFGMSMPKVKGPEFHLGLSKKDVNVTIPEVKAGINLPDVELEAPSTNVDTEGSAFQMPNLSVSLPKVKGPDINLSLPKRETDITLPETEAEVTVPDASNLDVSLGKAEVLIPEATVEVKKPEVQIKPLQTDVELEGQGYKFKMPKFGITMPKVKGPEIDLSLSKKDVHAKLPDAKADLKLKEGPEVDFEIEGELDGQGSKFKMPKSGMSVPKVKGPEVDFSLSKTDVDVTLPEAKAEVSVPGADIKEPSAKVDYKAAETDVLLGDVKGSPSKFKLPTFKFPKFGVTTPNISAEIHDTDKEIKIDGADMHISVPHTDSDVPEVKAEVHMPHVEVKESLGGIETEQQLGVEVDSKQKKQRFSLPKFSFSKPSIKAPEVDVRCQDVNIEIPEGKVEVKEANVDIKPPVCELEADEQESRFKFPKFGITMPKVTGPEIDLSFPKKDVQVTLPEAKAEVKLPDVELDKPSAAMEVNTPEIKVGTKDTESSPSKFKMPTFKLPKFGVGSPSVSAEVHDVDKGAKIDGADIKIPEEVIAVSIAAPSIDTKGASIDIKSTEIEHEGKGSKFKMPSLGFSMSQAKVPGIDLSLPKKDVDVTLPEAKAEVKLPDVELKKPSAEVEIKAPEIKVGTKKTEVSPSKFKMPTFKLPKFGAGTPSVTAEGPDVDKSFEVDGADIKVPEEVLSVSISAPSIDTKGPSIDIKSTEIEHEGKGIKFKLPSLGFSMSKAKGPDIDLSLPKKDVDVTLPEAKAEVKLPDVELKKPSAEEEIKAPEIKVVKKETEGSPSKYKMPTFKLPKFGVGSPSVSAEVPDVDKGAKIHGADIKIPEEVLSVTIAAPSIDTKGPSVDIKSTEIEHEGKGSKFKMPSLGFSGFQTKGPGIDLSLSKKDVDVTLPEAKAEVKLPEVELKKPSAEVEVKAPDIKVGTKDKEVSPSKFKMPTFKLPKFGAGIPSVTAEGPDMDKDVKIDGADIKVPEEVLSVTIAAPSIDTKGPSIDVKTPGSKHEGKGSKFKMPSLGFSMSQAKGPGIDLSLPKKDVDVTLPEAKAEVKLPEVELKKPSADVEIKAPDIKVGTKDKEVSPSKYKMPAFKLPKFGVGTPGVTAEGPDMDKDVKIDGANIKIPEEVIAVSIAAPSIDTKGASIDIKGTEIEHEVKGSKFKMPSLGFSGFQAKGPGIDLSLSKKDVDVTLPEAKAEVKLPEVELKKPSAEVEVKTPEIKVGTKKTEVSPSKFKMPTFKLPKFGAGTPSVTAEGPDIDKDVKIDGADIKVPEEVLSVTIAAPSIDTKGPSVDIKSTEIEHEGKGSKFKMPSLGFSMSQAKAPGIDLSLPKKDVDVTLPEAKAEVKLPEVELKKPSAEVEIKAPDIKVGTKDKEVSPSKFKMPIFKLPKFGAGTPSVTAEGPDIDKDVQIDGADIKVPEEVLSVTIASPSIDTRAPSTDLKTSGTEHEGKGIKFKMPSLGFSMSQAKAPGIDLSLPKKDVDVTLPEAKAEVKLSEVELKKPSAEVEIKAPEIQVGTKKTEVSPSKFKMPTFKLPKFGAGTPSVTAEGPDIDKDVKIDGADIKVPEEVLSVTIADPSIDTKGPSVDVKSTEIEHEGKGSKFKMPSLGFSMSQAKVPGIDLSLPKKDVDVTILEAKDEVKLPEVEVKQVEIAVSTPDVPTAEVDAKLKGSSWAFPKFSFSRTSGKTPDVTSPEVKAEICLPDAEVKGPSGSISTGQIPAAELDTNLKKNKFSLPRFSFSKSSGKEPEVSAELPQVDVCIPEGEVKVKYPEMEIKAPELEVKHSGQGSTSKMLGIGQPKAKGPEVDATLPEVKAVVKLSEHDVKESSASVEMKGSEADAETKDVGGSPLKFKMPTLKMKFGGASYDVTKEAAKAEKAAEIDGMNLKEDVTVTIKSPSIDIKTDAPKSADPETPKTETDDVVLASPSKFKLPSFKMPRLSFSKAKPEDEYVDTECKEDELKKDDEAKGESKSPKLSLTSFGEILKNIDVELDVSKAEENLDMNEADKLDEKKVEAKEKETNTKQDTVKSPERTVWFKFPRFGLSSPSEPAKTSPKDEQKDRKSPGGVTGDEEISPTCSVQSSDAFADVSSAVTSENLGPSLSSPTKVTVKYTGPDIAADFGEIHSNIITSTARTELISVEPNLPEKITILSSGVSSSSEDTLRLDSRKIHVITSNIQGTPEAQHAKLLSAAKIESAGGFPLKSGSNEEESWTVEDTQSGKRTLFERHLVRETSGERSESKETIVITKQITHVFDSSEPISGETASSIQRLRDSVHSEKMRFFDGADK